MVVSTVFTMFVSFRARPPALYEAAGRAQKFGPGLIYDDVYKCSRCTGGLQDGTLTKCTDVLSHFHRDIVRYSGPNSIPIRPRIGKTYHRRRQNKRNQRPLQQGLRVGRVVCSTWGWPWCRLWKVSARSVGRSDVVCDRLRQRERDLTAQYHVGFWHPRFVLQRDNWTGRSHRHDWWVPRCVSSYSWNSGGCIKSC